MTGFLLLALAAVGFLILVVGFWAGVTVLARHWVGRDVLKQFRPDRRRVARRERQVDDLLSGVREAGVNDEP